MLNNSSGIALSIVLFCLIAGLGFVIMEKLQNTVNSSSTAYSQIGKIISAMSTLVDFLPATLTVSDVRTVVLLASIPLAPIAILLLNAFGEANRSR